MSYNEADQGPGPGSLGGALLGAMLSVCANRVGFKFSETLRDSGNTGGVGLVTFSSSDDGSLEGFAFYTGTSLIPLRLGSRLPMHLSSRLVAFGLLWGL